MEKVVEYLKNHIGHFVMFESKEEIDIAVSYFDRCGYGEDGVWSYKNLCVDGEDPRNCIAFYKINYAPLGWQISAFRGGHVSPYNIVMFKDIYNNRQTFESEKDLVQYVMDNHKLVLCNNYEEYNCYVMLLERNGCSHACHGSVCNDTHYYKWFAEPDGEIYVELKEDWEFWLWSHNHFEDDEVEFEELYAMLK